MSNVFPEIVSATVAVDTTDSNVVDLDGLTLVGVEIPATVNGTAITFKASADSAAAVAAVYAKDETAFGITTTSATARFVHLNPAETHGWRWVQLICGTTQTTTATVFRLVLRDMR